MHDESLKARLKEQKIKLIETVKQIKKDNIKSLFEIVTR